MSDGESSQLAAQHSTIRPVRSSTWSAKEHAPFQQHSHAHVTSYDITQADGTAPITPSERNRPSGCGPKCMQSRANAELTANRHAICHELMLSRSFVAVSDSTGAALHGRQVDAGTPH